MSLVPTRVPSMFVHILCLLTLAAADSPADTLPRSLLTKRRLSGGEWTAYVSEEGGEALCNGLVTGMRCKGKNCDDVSLLCDQSTLGTTYSGKWSSYFSEEKSGEHVCDGYLTGIRCDGKYCDDVSVQCSSVDRGSPTNCRWSPWFSEEGTGRVEYSPPNYLRGVRCEGKYCDNKQAYVCSSELCHVGSVEGSWKPDRTIHTEQTQTLSWGMEAQHESSRSTEWSSSLSTTVSAGFEVKAFSFSAEVSTEVSELVAQSVSDALTTSKTEEIEFDISEENVGKTLWQFVFKSDDSCNNEETIKTKEFAFTEGVFREPCCLPGWALDAPAYTRCATGGLIANLSENPICSEVEPTSATEAPISAAIEHCANEGQTCQCTGRVYYGRRFVNGKPGYGQQMTFEQMQEFPFETMDVQQQVGCGNSALGDPLHGYYKQCFCEEDVRRLQSTVLV